MHKTKGRNCFSARPLLQLVAEPVVPAVCPGAWVLQSIEARVSAAIVRSAMDGNAPSMNDPKISIMQQVIREIFLLNTRFEIVKPL